MFALLTPIELYALNVYGLCLVTTTSLVIYVL